MITVQQLDFGPSHTDESFQRQQNGKPLASDIEYLYFEGHVNAVGWAKEHGYVIIHNQKHNFWYATGYGKTLMLADQWPGVGFDQWTRLDNIGYFHIEISAGMEEFFNQEGNSNE